MAEKTRQQRRARERSPRKTRRRGATAFLTVMLLLLLGGGVLIAVFRSNPPPLTRGASAGEHWHARYSIYICGKQVSNFPNIEGELHSHGDPFIHIHPHTPAASGDLASLGTWLRTYQTNLFTGPDGKTELTFPNGDSYKDGDTCPDAKGEDAKTKHNIIVTNKGEPIEGDPGDFLPHDGDEIEIRFGEKGNETMPNPYSEVRGLPDLGAGGATPGPEGPSAPTEEPSPEGSPSSEDDEPSDGEPAE